MDFEDLTQIFPLADGITCQGTLDAGLRGKVRVSDVTEGNYGKIYLGGKLKARDVEIFIPKTASSPDTDGRRRLRHQPRQ